MVNSPEALQRMRQAWRCDCDGESHHSSVVGHESIYVGRVREGIGRIVGVEPPTCPWRAFYLPDVAVAVDLARFADKGNLAAVVDNDTPSVWIDALTEYTQARDGARAHFDMLRLDKLKKQAPKRG